MLKFNKNQTANYQNLVLVQWKRCLSVITFVVISVCQGRKDLVF